MAEKARQAKEEQMKREREADRKNEDDEAGPAPRPSPQPAQRPSPQPAQKQKSPKSPPGAATQAPAAAVQPPIVPTQDDLNLGSLEMWDDISKTTIAWDNYTGIRVIVGNNDNIVASVMLFLFLRDNYTPEMTKANLLNKHFGYSDSDSNYNALITGLKKDVFNTTTTRSIGDEFFKIKDDGSNVNSILRMTLLGQRLNRVFFFLARHHKCSNYFGYKRTRGEGYDYANEIGLTDEEFKGIMEKSGDGIPSEITKLHRKIIVKIHPNAVASSAPVIKIVTVERSDGTVVQRETRHMARDDRGYEYSRYSDMYNEFRKWYAYLKKKKDLSYLKEERKYFRPVYNTVDWEDYEEKTANPIRYKDWFDL